MKLLVVGGGGREHAMVVALQKNPRIRELYCAPGNAGIAAGGAKCVDLKATDLDGVINFVTANGIDFVVVAPDDPLAMGMVDALNELGIPAFGPTKAAARIESSKVFSKNLMKRYGIPTAEYKVFSDAAKALAYLNGIGRYPVVVKADGLALGKGVVIAGDCEEACEAVNSIMEDKIFGDSGNEIVIEEFLTGPEVSVLAFCDGETVVPMVSSMDHKRIYDGNEGPNTGGMGTIAPNPHYTPEIARRCMEEIFRPTIKAMKKEGAPFRGCLYFGLMITGDGPKVIEYNCRFGDPEAQVVLPLLETDLLEIMEAICQGRLGELEIRWKDGAAACVIAASGGYPSSYKTGLPIQGLGEDGQVEGATVYHAGTKLADGGFATAGGRVLGVTATAGSLAEALEKAYQGIGKITFPGIHYRNDIGRY